MSPDYLVKCKKSNSAASPSDKPNPSYQRLKQCSTVGIGQKSFLFVTTYLFSLLRLSICMQGGHFEQLI